MTSTKPSTQTPDIVLDQDGHLFDYTVWTANIAQQLADTLDINLNTEHLDILQQVRVFFTKFNHAPATRPLIKWLQQTLPEQDITNQKLQQLFNTGLVARHVNRLAGLPKPPNCL
ncbi:TusE/DsrC/DsvC family sulfur relay protein [Psychrobacter sp. CAL346-MNA-CIBAN-0220]|uniref:TusE/DsrC/DsvC family sulfur relay protein n=1 Tax=Psychrobacter sp. CAL346-MNA-CIBAN-0220 TaxID=3140457 RepID=UPI00332D6BE7